MNKYIHQIGRANIVFTILTLSVFAFTFTTLSADADSYTYNQPSSCTISLRDVPSNYPTFNAPDGSGYPMLLSWSSSNATAASISPSMGNVPLRGSRVVYVRGETFSMAVYGPRGNATCQTPGYLLPSLYLPGSIVAGPVLSTYRFDPTYDEYYNEYYNDHAIYSYPAIPAIPENVYSHDYSYQAPMPPQISLTQIPYTGFDAGLVGTMLMWLAIIALATFGAVVLAQRGEFLEKVASRLRN